MGNIATTLKRFLSNKNTVTILGVILGIVVLYIGYNYRVNSAVSTVSVPYAKVTINATEEITKDDVGTIDVLNSFVSSNSNLISNINDVVSTSSSKCVTTGTSIPAGGLFYQEQIADCSTVANNALKNMPDGYKPFVLSVDLQSTFGNSMYPGDYIDLYIKMNTDDGKLLYSCFVTKLPILDVRDSSGNSVFATAGTSATPASLLFGVPEDLYLLLSKANYLSNITLVPVPGNATYTSTVGETKVQSEYLRNLIEQYTADVPDEVVTTTTTTE